MKTSFLQRTARSSIVPVGTALRDHSLLKAAIAERLGEDAAILLADPVASTEGNHIDWYVTGRVDPVPLSGLAPADRETIEAVLADYHAQIETMADEAQRRGTARDLQMAESLRSIFSIPGPEHIFVVDGKPVLTAWAHRASSGREERVGLSVRARDPAPMVPSSDRSYAAPPTIIDETAPATFAGVTEAVRPAPDAPRRRGGLWLALLLWLLFAGIVLAIFALLLRACAFAGLLGFMGIPSACGERSPVDISSLQLIAADLEDQARRASVPCATGTETDAAAVADAEARTRDLTRGDLEIALIWQTEDDLDLHVAFNCGPAAQPAEIGYQRRGQNICGGVLDQDANVGTTSRTPAEHIVWVNNADVPDGPMKVIVSYYADKGPPSPQIPYQVVITRGGAAPQVIDGTIRTQQIVPVTTIQN